MTEPEKADLLNALEQAVNILGGEDKVREMRVKVYQKEARVQKASAGIAESLWNTYHRIFYAYRDAVEAGVREPNLNPIGSCLYDTVRNYIQACDNIDREPRVFSFDPTGMVVRPCPYYFNEGMMTRGDMYRCKVIGIG